MSNSCIMENIKNIAVTGYYGTGSSAVLDFLSEYSNVSWVPINKEVSDYEHVLFYYAGGLFDLCNQLMHGNTIMGSDAAINRFLDSMNRLYKYNFRWFGSYKKMFGNQFMDITNEFVKDISVSFNGRNCNHCTRMSLSLKGTIKRLLFSLCHFRFSDPRVYNYLYDTKDVYLSLPTHDELISATRKYSKAYMGLFPVKKGSEFRLFDHLIWPQQIEDYADYLDSNLKIILTYRDVRDIYIRNKYYNKNPYFPTDIDDFISVYSRIVKKNVKHPNLITIQFEDMIYKYEEVEGQLESEMGLDPSQHFNKQTLFNPNVSIENTQLFRCNKTWYEESKILAEAMPDLIYDHPYERIPDGQKSFAR